VVAAGGDTEERAIGTESVRTAAGCKRVATLMGSEVPLGRAGIDADILTLLDLDWGTNFELERYQRDSRRITPRLTDSWLPPTLDFDTYCLGWRGPRHPHCGSLTAAAHRDLHYLGPALL
jgi:hypothetical protein